MLSSIIYINILDGGFLGFWLRQHPNPNKTPLIIFYPISVF
nr:MAG TPA: hypothetical protein [Caudoviricetes sp.]